MPADPTVSDGEIENFQPNGADIALMREVQAENVTWNKRSFRLWSDDETYSLVTAMAKRLVQHGYLKTEMAAGFSYVQRGPVELTRLGREALHV